MPDDRETWRRVALGLDAAARQDGAVEFATAPRPCGSGWSRRSRRASSTARSGTSCRRARAWKVVTRAMLSAFYSHPWAWNEIGFGGPAYPRGYARLGAGQRENWEGRRRRARSVRGHGSVARSAGRRHARARTLLRGGPPARATTRAFLLDVHRRAVPPRADGAATTTRDAVDMVIVGAGAGGATLAQRLARRGWKVVVLEAGPFWDPDEDWVSDEAGSHKLYWTEERIIGGDPTRSSSARTTAATASAGRWSTTPATARAFTRPTSRSARATASRRIGRSPTADLKPHYERLELELPVAGEYWPWGDPHRLPAHRPPDRRRRRDGPRRRAEARDRDAGGACRDHQRRVRQPPALHLPRLLPAGLQGEREGVAARHPHPRRDRARRRDPR